MNKLPIPLRNGLLTLLLGSGLVVIAYYYVDRSVAYWVYAHQLNRYVILKWFTYLAPAVTLLTVIIYPVWLWRFFYRCTRPLDKAGLALANSVVITIFFKDQLKIMFGRYWPQTWTHGNLSLISNHAYGFRFFQGGSGYDAFPSGHTAVIVAAMLTLWWHYPRFRLLYAIAIALVVIGLIGMNYHFVGDVIGGATVGGLVAYWVTQVLEFSH